MANTSTPTQSTYQQKRVQFYRNTNQRTVNTDKDRWYLNVFLETEATPNTNERSFTLRNRGGLQYITSFPAGTRVRGSCNHEGHVYFVIDQRFYDFNGTSVTLKWTMPEDTGKDVGIVPWNDSDEIDYLIIGDGKTLYKYRMSDGNVSTAPAGYPVPFHPSIQAVDGYIVMSKLNTADIYNSQVEALTTNWDFITAELYPDSIVALSRYNNYIVALGRHSVELFYDAAITSGSPFQRNDSTTITVGCTSPRSIVQSERQLLWVGNSQEGQLGIWMLEKFDVQEITPPLLRKVLSRQDFDPEVFKAFVIRHQGHKFYVLTLGPTANPYQEIWAYDMNEKFWYKWEIAGGLNKLVQLSGDDDSGRAIVITTQGVMEFSDSIYKDLNLTPTFEWQTDPQDFETMNRKACHRISIVGNRAPGQEFLVSWSDDDYVSWSNERTIKMDLERPAVVQMGRFRRRAWNVRNEQPLPILLDSLEVYYNLMGN